MVEWADSPGATRYQVSHSTTSGADNWEDALSPQLITGLTNGTMYYVKVRAGNDNEWGQPTAEAVAIPIGGILGMWTIPGDGQLEVFWDDAQGATGYDIRHGIHGNPIGPPPTNWMDATSPHTITGLTNGTKYYVDIRGKNSTGVGEFVRQVRGVPMAPPATPPPTEDPTSPEDPDQPPMPPGPGSLTVMAGDRELRLRWDPIAGADVYELAVVPGPWIGPLPLESWRPIQVPLPETTYVVTQLPDGTELSNGMLYVVGIRAIIIMDGKVGRTKPVISGGTPKENPHSKPEKPEAPKPTPEPEEPVAPDDPEEPQEPEEPREPEEPNEPEDPEKPEETPGKPTDPKEPGEPEEPRRPGEPEEPGIAG